MKKKMLFLGVLCGLTCFSSYAQETVQELRKVIEEQKKILAQLEKRIEQTEANLEMTAQAVEQTAVEPVKTTIGGYGELHYNNIKNNVSGETTKELDFHRFVLFIGHQFNDKTRFFSELELEHSVAGEGKNGEIELEQAYIEHDINDELTARMGMFIMPVGILNETHEPPTFYGVERNPIERDILPSTWWEGGLSLNVKLAPGLALDAAITSGLNTPLDGSNAFKPRSGRQKVSEANANDLAYTSRIKYTAIPGLELAATLQYQSDLAQGTEGFDSASATLFTTHLIYAYEQFNLRALYARWDIDGSQAKALGRDKQQGFYIEPSYRINEDFGVFARYNAWDNNAGINGDTEVKQTNVGLNYWLHENAVLKFDLEKQSGANDAEGFNLGVGYQF